MRKLNEKKISEKKISEKRLFKYYYLIITILYYKPILINSFLFGG